MSKPETDATESDDAAVTLAPGRYELPDTLELRGDLIVRRSP